MIQPVRAPQTEKQDTLRRGRTWGLLTLLALLVAVVTPSPSGVSEPAELGARPTTIAGAPSAPTPTPQIREDVVVEREDERPTATEPGRAMYEVQSGDTLWAIATEHDLTVDAIVAANDLDDPDAIFPGDVLEIPEHPGTEAGGGG